MALYYLPQYKVSALNVPGGIDDSQTTGIILSDVTNIDITEPGLVCVTYTAPIDTSKAEYITYTSIDGSNELQGVTRGEEGVSAKSHSDGAVVGFVISKSHINNVNDLLTGVEAGIKVKTALYDTNGNEVIKTPATSSAVNEITVTNAATNGSPSITATGGDTNINLLASGKGTGLFIPQIPLAEGQMINGKLSVTVASNNLTVALKTNSGADPSAASPVYVMIDGTLRSVTSALSATRDAGTNWHNAGSAELATKEIDYFAYLKWDTAYNTVDIAFSRVPYVTLGSEPSATTTNELYMSTSLGLNATDTYAVVGRFAATLSAGAGYTWSVPTFTATNLIQRPIYETRWLTWEPTKAWTAGTAPSSTESNVRKSYMLRGDMCFIDFQTTYGSAGSTVTRVSLTMPINLGNPSNANFNTMAGFMGVNGTANASYAYTVNGGSGNQFVWIVGASSSASAIFASGFYRISA